MVVGEDGGPWNDHTHERRAPRVANQGLVRFIAEHLSPINFLEFGSGLGRLAAGIARAAETQFGYCIEPLITAPHEQSLGLKLFNYNIFESSTPEDLNQKFDLVISIEVAEHIDKKNHETLFNFLVSRSSNWVVFSAARPGQGGLGHVAERPELEWRQEFTDRGLEWSEELSLLARRYSDEKNINHKKNLLVFRNTARYQELDLLEKRARPYLKELLSIVERHGDRLMGNLFYVNLSDARSGMPVDSLRNKRLNLFKKSRLARSILEVGFNAGHSCLLMLLADTSSRILVVDNLQTPYARDCFNFLDRAFPGRLTLMPGDCLEVLPVIEHGTIDLVHLDAGKEFTLEQDLDNLQKIVIRDHVLVIDDTHNKNIQAIIDKQVLDCRISPTPFREENLLGCSRKYKHLLARFKFCESREVRGKVSDIIKRYHPLDLEPVNGKLFDSTVSVLLNIIEAIEFGGLKGAFFFSDEIPLLAATQLISRFIPREILLIGNPNLGYLHQVRSTQSAFSTFCMSAGVAQRAKEIDISELDAYVQRNNKSSMIACSLAFYQSFTEVLVILIKEIQVGGWLVLELPSVYVEREAIASVFLEEHGLTYMIDCSDTQHMAFQASR